MPRRIVNSPRYKKGTKWIDHLHWTSAFHSKLRSRIYRRKIMINFRTLCDREVDFVQITSRPWVPSFTLGIWTSCSLAIFQMHLLGIASYFIFWFNPHEVPRIYIGVEAMKTQTKFGDTNICSCVEICCSMYVWQTMCLEFQHLITIGWSSFLKFFYCDANCKSRILFWRPGTNFF